jgi:anthranilate phosphoribosyltransferase
MTPRCFAAWSKGRGDAAKRRADDQTALAYMTAFFTRTTKKVNLADYLIAAKSKKAQTPAEMLEAFRQFQDRGAKMNFRKIN